MPWERGESAPAAEAPAPSTEAASASAEPTPPPAPASAAGSTLGMTDTVKQLLAAYPKWGKSAVAAEQARRKRTGLPVLTDAEVAALLGEAPAAAPATPAAAAPKPGAPVAVAARPPATPVAAIPASPPSRTGVATS